MGNLPLLLLFIISTVLNLSLAIYAWGRHDQPGAKTFSLAMIMFAALPLAQAVNESSPDLAIKVIALKSRVITAGIGATAWLVMMMQLTGYSHLINRRSLLALSLMPLLFLVLDWTENPLFRSGYYLYDDGSATILRWSNGPLFWLGFAYLNLVLIAPLYLLWRSYHRISPLSLRQTLALVISVVLPIALNLLIQLGITPLPGINFPFAAGPLMGIIVALAIFQYRVFDIVPIARGLLIEGMSDGVMVLDTQNRVVDINPAMQRFVGPVIIGQNAESVFAVWPHWVARFRDIAETQTEIMVDVNPPQYIDLRISALYDQNTHLMGKLIVVRDITDQKQREAALRASESNLRHILESTPDAMLIIDQSGDITFANAQSEKTFGFTQKEMLGQPVEMLLPEHLHEIHKSHRANYYRNPQTRPMGAGRPNWQLIAHCKDGTEIPVEISLSPFETETGLYATAAVRDITARRQMEEMLARERDLLQSLMDNIPDTIYFKDTASRFTRINRAQANVLGVENPRDAIGKTDFDFQPNHLAEVFYAEEQKIVASGESLVDRIEYNPTPDGTARWFSATKVPLKDSQGKVVGIVGISRNITERKQADDLLQRQAEYLTALHQISLDLLNRRSVDDLLQGIVDRATEFLNAPFCEIMFVEDQELVVRAFTRNQPFLAGDRIKRGEANLSWKAFDTHEAVVVNDYSHWPLRRAIYEGLGLGAVVALPIMAGNKCIGVLDLSRSESGHIFDDSAIQAANLFAQLAALVLDDTQLYADAQHEIEERKRTEETLRRQNEYLTALHEVTLGLINRHDPDALLEATLFHAADLMKTHHAFVDIVDPTQQVLIQKVAIGNYTAQLGYRTRSGEGLTGRVWESGEILIIPDYQNWEYRLSEFLWLRTVAGIPIKIQGKVIGVIGISFDEPDRIFTSEEIELLQRFANLASMALDNAQLISNAVRQSQELSLLHNVRTAMAREFDLTQITKRAVEAIVETFGYTLVSLYMLQGDMLVLKHQVGYAQAIRLIPIDKGISGRVIRTGEAVFLEDVHSDPSFLGAIEGIVSEVAVPIFDQGRVIGVLNIESSSGVKLTEADLHLVEDVGDQISIAIGRARLYDSLQRNNKQLSLLHQTTLELIKESNMQDLLQTIVDQATTLLEADVGYLALAEGEKLVDRAISPKVMPYEKLAVKGGKAQNPVWQVYDSREPFVTEDYSSLSEIKPKTKDLELRATLLLPLLTSEACKGVLGTARVWPGYKFGSEELQIGSLFARVAGLAIDNAQLHETLRQEAIHDPLTGLFNRRFMQEALEQEILKAKRNSRPLAVVMLDLDHFKRINDMFGHDAGDQALRRLARLLQKKMRGGDIVCRYGGEEFTLILPEVLPADALKRMEQLRQDIKKLIIKHEGKTISRLSGSFGVAISPTHGSTADKLLKVADQALYQAKRAGRDRVISA